MAVLSTAFTHVHTAVSPVTCGSGTLQPNHTLVLVHVMACDYTSYDFSGASVGLANFTVDSNRNAFNGLGNPALRMHTLSYINDTGLAIDLTNAISLYYSGSGSRKLATSIRAFTMDAPMEANNSATWALAGNVSPNIVGFASTTSEIAIGSVSAYEDILAYSWVDGSSNYQTAHAAVGGNVPVTGPESWIQAFDYIGVPDEGGGVVTLSLSGSTTSDTNVAAIVSYLEKQVESGSISTMPMTLQLGLRDIPVPVLLVETELAQRYSLSLLQTQIVQPYYEQVGRSWGQPYGDLSPVASEIVDAPYKLGFDSVEAEIAQSFSMTVATNWFQPYGSLQAIAKEIVTANYKLGFDDVAAEFDQAHSLIVESAWEQGYGSLVTVAQEIVSAAYKLGFDEVSMELDQSYSTVLGRAISQEYTSLQSVAKEVVAANYKLGFDEVYTEVEQPYSKILQREFDQPSNSLIQVAGEITQGYTTFVRVGAELVAIYDLTPVDIISFNLTSHYTMYQVDTITVVNSGSGLIYKSGYTATPEL